MKKTIDATGIMNELRGQSAFFPKEREKQPAPPRVQQEKEAHENNDTMASRYHETKTPDNRDTTIPLSEKDMVEAVRKAVKQIGREPATQRLTLEEKQALDDIEYSYKRQGIKTSANEIIRIATNYIVREYRQNGENSILAKVIQSLNF